MKFSSAASIWLISASLCMPPASEDYYNRFVLPWEIFEHGLLPFMDFKTLMVMSMTCIYVQELCDKNFKERTETENFILNAMIKQNIQVLRNFSLTKAISNLDYFHIDGFSSAVPYILKANVYDHISLSGELLEDIDVKTLDEFNGDIVMPCNGLSIIYSLLRTRNIPKLKQLYEAKLIDAFQLSIISSLVGYAVADPESPEKEIALAKLYDSGPIDGLYREYLFMVVPPIQSIMEILRVEKTEEIDLYLIYKFLKHDYAMTEEIFLDPRVCHAEYYQKACQYVDMLLNENYRTLDLDPKYINVTFVLAAFRKCANNILSYLVEHDGFHFDQSLFLFCYHSKIDIEIIKSASVHTASAFNVRESMDWDTSFPIEILEIIKSKLSAEDLLLVVADEPAYATYYAKLFEDQFVDDVHYPQSLRETVGFAKLHLFRALLDLAIKHESFAKRFFGGAITTNDTLVWIVRKFFESLSIEQLEEWQQYADGESHNESVIPYLKERLKQISQ